MTFIPGLELSRAYWHDVVAPIVDGYVAPAERAVALIGRGSDVLGFDTDQSTDHSWGPRLQVFVLDQPSDELDRAIDAALPASFRGYPTRFPALDDSPVRHQVTITTVPDFFAARLGFDPRAGIAPIDWLATPTQVLRELTSGVVFEDGPGELTRAREPLTWYPDDVWLYVLGCQWRRLDQDEPLVGRTGQVGDDLGSRIVGARLVRDLMRLCFLVERTWAPYAKWLGTGFARLECGSDLGPVLRAALAATDWHGREEHLVRAFEYVATRFNELGVAEPVDPTVRGFWNRPFRVLGSQRFADVCLARTPLHTFGYVGAIDQFVDNTDVLEDPDRAARVRRAFTDRVTAGRGGRR
jgi:hypothetical protein